MEIKVIYRNGDESVEISIPVSISGSTTISTPSATFNASELAEADRLATEAVKAKFFQQPNANDVFGSKLAEGVRYTAVAEALPTAPVDMLATTSTPVPSALVPPAPSNVSVTAPVVPVPSSRVTGGELDSAGMPWDARINSDTRSKVANGTWKLKRGVNTDLVTQVTAELKAIMAIPSPALTVEQVAQVATDVAVATFAPPPPVAVVPPAPLVLQFKDLLRLITAKGLDNEAITGACVQAGLPNLPSLAQRPDLVPTVAQILGLV